MAQSTNPTHRVRVEEVDWQGLLPFIRLFRSFRMAIHPAKLFTALLLAVLLYLGGRLLDAMWGPVVYPGEVVEYATSAPGEFATWLTGREEDAKRELSARLYGLDPQEVDLRQLMDSPDRFAQAEIAINSHYESLRKRAIEESGHAQENKVRLRDQLATIQRLRKARVDTIRAIKPNGVFDTALQFEVDAFERLLGGATVFNLGIGELLRGQPHDRTSVVGALREMFWIVPGWLYSAHRGFLLIYCAVGFGLWALFGGAIARMAALHATRDQRIGPTAALSFAISRWPWFLLGPLIPVLLALCIILALFLFGLAFFGLPIFHVVLDILGGLAFVLPILLGLAAALVLIGAALACHLIYPAIAIEGSDGFDANSRAYSYVAGRPWHVLFYSLLALVYGALTYLFVGAVIFLALLLAQTFVGLGANLFMAGEGGRSFDAILERPEISRLTYSPDWSALKATGKIAAVLTMVWVYLFAGLLAAYAISFYFSAQTWIYLLLRRMTDGTEFDDVYEQPAARLEPAPNEPPAPGTPDKIEPSASAGGGES